MVKVAIVGCGKIADSHASMIQLIDGCEIVGVCDQEELMGRQLAERFSIKQSFTDLRELLNMVRPDVVHITTPPQSHFNITKLCLDWGAHVYVEKPFTINEEEAKVLVGLADQKRLKLTVGHDDQFIHAARRMRDLVRSGYLGGHPIHMESYYCYDLSEPGYAKAVLGDKKHWVRGLPGKLLHNVISHGIARVAEFLQSEAPEVIAYGFTSPLLKKMGENEIVDELRVIISEDGCRTAYFTFSSQMRPSLHHFRLYGPKNGLILDQDQETLIKVPGKRLKSYVEKFVPSVCFAGQYLDNVKGNIGLFLRRDFQMKAGMKFLIESFYKSISRGTPLPIPYREILLTAKIMDQIFSQLNARHQQCQFEVKRVAG